MIVRLVLALAGLVAAYNIWQALASGAVTPDGRYSRLTQPQQFWAILGLMVLVVGASLYYALVGLS
ncbi:MAG: hypothetical protein ACM3ZV_04855 [Bacillota bacterium]